ncbi:hypothetical protein HYH03_003417 [Edaphochlamys debaryana]|uniref:Kazal-like domain-containing protein n=1 Tax=Edaphochlamys debaryana TaxID=47281 RepID=A0A836C4D9_9CHLO|nr:hypothetical protein HYH03_003417 [Edaphochlamys debaryana]|eukprot:KAG2498672.1 hypothetical protein HYH03_003417 [Edaphochlamys debaryana]
MAGNPYEACRSNARYVCGTDGETRSPCATVCSGIAAACYGECPPRPSATSGSAACNCPAPGPAEAVCAVDGTAYASACLARCANAAVAYDGSCPLTMTAMSDPNAALPMCRTANGPSTESGSPSPGSAQRLAPLLPPGVLLALTAAVGAALLLLV